MTRSYLRLDSWHVRGPVPIEGWDTLCGRHVNAAQKAPVSDQLPLGEKSCETCLRLATAHEAEIEAQVAAERDPVDGVRD